MFNQRTPVTQNISTTDDEREDERFSLPLFVLLVFVRSQQPAFCSPPVLVKEFPEKYDKQSEAEHRHIMVEELPGKYKTRVNEFV